MLAMEVLDNLPHDKLTREHAEAQWEESLVQSRPERGARSRLSALAATSDQRLAHTAAASEHAYTESKRPSSRCRDTSLPRRSRLDCGRRIRVQRRPCVAHPVCVGSACWTLWQACLACHKAEQALPGLQAPCTCPQGRCSCSRQCTLHARNITCSPQTSRGSRRQT